MASRVNEVMCPQRVAREIRSLGNTISCLTSASRLLGHLAREVQSQPNLGARYQGIMELIPSHFRRRLWTQEAQGSFSVVSADTEFTNVWETFCGLSDLDRMRATDIATHLPGDLLTKVDIA